MRPCPNCGRGVPAGQTLCPNCGTPLPSDWPPPVNLSAPLPPEPRLLTGNVTGDFVLGLCISLISLPLLGLGLLVMPIVYTILRSKRKPYLVLARGIGWGALAGWAVVLGAFALCLYGLSHEH